MLVTRAIVRFLSSTALVTAVCVAAACDDGSDATVDSHALAQSAAAVDAGPAATAAARDAGAPQDRVPLAAEALDGSGSRAADAGASRPLISVDADGPFATTEDLATGARRRSGLFRPTELGRDGMRHPVLVWGCGGGSTPRSYSELLRRVASHGFVVMAEISEIGDNGAPLTAALDWLDAENGRAQSALSGKLDTRMAAIGGHSIGSVNAFIVAPGPRWVTSIHVAGGSLDNVRDPRAPTTGKGGKALLRPAAFICSERDSFGNVDKTQKDYDQTRAPVFFTIMAGTEHVGAAREGLPVIIGWLRWHLMGESERRGMFLDPQGVFSSGRYNTRTKNW